MLNILHIDRSELSSKAFKLLASELGHKVYGCKDVQLAENILYAEDIDIVVTAIVGNDKIFEILSESRFTDIPVLVLTSTDTIQTRQKLYEFGVSDYIIKGDLTLDRLKSFFGYIEKVNGQDMVGRKFDIAVLDDSMLSLGVIKKIMSNTPYSNISYYSDPIELLKQDKEYTIYLIDLVLPKMSGEEVMLEIRSKYKDAIIIIVSSVNNYKTISNLLLLGADDYLNKPFDRNFFLARIGLHLKSYFLRKDLEEKNLELERLANRDGLTSLYNHKFIMDKLEEKCSESDGTNGICVAMIDIDHFKRVNDEYGHPVGDAILIGVSRILEDSVDDVDYVGRYGGEEFLIVFVNKGLNESIAIAKKINFRIEKTVFTQINHVLTVSGGVSVYQEQSIAELIKAADSYLYKAKKSGRNRICDDSCN